jgi:hypothetical protein
MQIESTLLAQAFNLTPPYEVKRFPPNFLLLIIEGDRLTTATGAISEPTEREVRYRSATGMVLQKTTLASVCCAISRPAQKAFLIPMDSESDSLRTELEIHRQPEVIKALTTTKLPDYPLPAFDPFEL